jgi:predicted dehydrogenase
VKQVTGHRPVRWGILGTGKIARIFGAALRLSRTGELVAVGSRSMASAERFGADLGVPRRHGSYAQALADAEVDVVYIATPHPTHAGLIAEAARQGKHILCEKPLTVTAAEARHAVDIARRHGVFLMEGFAFRCHPQTERLVSLIRDGAVGEVRMLEAAFGYDAGPSPRNYLLDRDLAGGSILDVGCYTVAMCRLLARVALGSDHGEPMIVTGTGDVSASHGVDLRAVGGLAFESGLIAQVGCAIDANLGSSLRVLGSQGVITLTDPWLPGRGRPATITLNGRSGEKVWPGADTDGDLYAVEADEVARCLAHGESPAMRLTDSLGNMEALDRWRHAVGVSYLQDVRPTPGQVA